MPPNPFILVSPSTRGLSLALTRHFLRTTSLPVVATYRSGSFDTVHKHILSPLQDVDPARLKLVQVELTSEESIAAAADTLSRTFAGNTRPRIHTAFFGGGILHPERQPSDLDAQAILQTFQLNVVSHLLVIKHFSRFLPEARDASESALAKWVHVSARVGSVSDNRLGGWYSYRASKAALNQVVRTFDLDLQRKRVPAMCVGVHPGTVKTDLSRDFWSGVPKDKLFEPEYAAELVAGVVQGLKEEQRGRIWDWAGKEVIP